ncbi:MAG: hypothetical protein V1484_02050 [bacterium]
MITKTILKKNKGFVILFAVTLSAILLSIALGVANIAFREIKFSTSAKDTNNAFFAADTGIECAFINDKSSSIVFIDPNPSPSIMCNGNSITATENPTSFWSFIVSGLGNTGTGCAKVTVDKTTALTTITSKGYNNGSRSGGSSPPPSPTFSATGGTITYSGGYTIHTFTSSGTLTVTGSGNVEVLVVGGGGGGGKGDSDNPYGAGGGGGAGGYIYNENFAITPQAYSVTVGSGGAGGSGTYIYGPIPEWNGRNGGNSIFGTLIAIGGGGGGGATLSGQAGGSGGGGGGGHNYSPSGGTGTGGQGNKGGNTSLYSNRNASGGGGQATVGGNATASVGGNGGAGVNNSISGVSVGYAGGGAAWVNGVATHGGGNAMVAGTANTGGGGGGGKGNGDPQVGRAGGSGVVIVRYLTPDAGGSGSETGTCTPGPNTVERELLITY